MGFDAAELRKFTDAGQAISRSAGIAFEQWAEGEMGLVLKTWAGAIGAPTLDQVELRARRLALKKLGLQKGKVTINTGRRGREGNVWVRAKNGKYRLAGKVAHNAGAFAPSGIHFANDQWRDAGGGVTDYQSQAGVIGLAKRTIGLARQSVVQIGDALGTAIEKVAGGGGLSGQEVAQARSAVAGDGKTYQNGFGTRTKSGDRFSIEAINRSPLIQHAKIDSALAFAIGQRVGVAEKVLGDKLLESAERTAKAFPYLQIRR